MIHYSHYQEDYFPQVLDLLNLSHTFDSFSESLLLEKIRDCSEDFSELVCAFSDKTLCGVVMAVVRQLPTGNTGFIKLMGVLPAFQKKGIGKQLLEKAELFAKSNNCSSIRFYDVPKNYFMPGIDPFYTNAIVFVERNGFRRNGDTSNLICDLNQEWDTQLQENELSQFDFSFKRADSSDFPAILAWVLHEFPLWEYELVHALNQDPCAVHIAYLKDELIAFAAHSSNNTSLAWFGPMGTSPKARGNGVGAVLLKRCLLDLKNQGFENAIIPWVGPIPFYAKNANATVNRIFWRYEKQLK
jgi:mycothiol synthase